MGEPGSAPGPTGSGAVPHSVSLVAWEKNVIQGAFFSSRPPLLCWSLIDFWLGGGSEAVRQVS